ncbi:MAG: hypothetical protein Q4C24_01075 [Candidatus Saccharibacteria bacterium]|nr:hypothetical protein [Candidatus Saccharibacteria bacterium]
MIRIFFPIVIEMPTYTEAISTFGRNLAPLPVITSIYAPRPRVDQFYRKLVPN